MGFQHRNAENTHDRAFCWGITPRFVVAGKDAKVAAANKLLIIETKDGVV